MESIEHEIVREIIEDLTDRRGLGWDDVDEDTKAEIRAAWIKIVKRIMWEATR